MLATLLEVSEVESTRLFLFSRAPPLVLITVTSTLHGKCLQIGVIDIRRAQLLTVDDSEEYNNTDKHLVCNSYLFHANNRFVGGSFTPT